MSSGAGAAQDALPLAVIEAWGLQGAHVVPISIGLVNRTYAARVTGRPALIVQRLHPVFGPEVNLDLEAITEHLAAKGLPTTRLVRTRAGEAWLEHGSEIWRAITMLEGRVFHAVQTPQLAHEAGALAGRFHRAVEDLDWQIQSKRAGVHDTAGHLAKLAQVSSDAELAPPAELAAGAAEVSQAILAHARTLEPLLTEPRRLVHGDLKITNLLFEDHKPPRGLAIIDLDTLARSTFPIEMGDALRSWCNRAGESAPRSELDPVLYRAALQGWASCMRDSVTADERDALALGTQTITLELSARFATDVFEDRYFGWDSANFESRRAHCLARARSMLALALSIQTQRAALEAIARDLM